MSALPKIPSPLSYHLREFRHSIMPFVVFAGVLFLTINLWNRHLAPANIVGEVGMVRANVTTTLPGEITDLQVDLFQRVEKDQVVATILTMEDDLLNASVGAAEANLLTLRERIHQDQMRLEENLAQLEQNLLTRVVDREQENVNYQYAVVDLRRVEGLFKENAVSATEYDLARNKVEALKQKIEALDRLISKTSNSLAVLNLQTTNRLTQSTNDPIAKAIEEQEQLLRVKSKPLVIKAPMAGIVSYVLKHKGEKVVRGEAIVTISAAGPERIIGYVRQPLNSKPKVGDTVEIRARSYDRPAAYSRILQVGTQLELIPVYILPPVMQNHGEYGLPILVSLPKTLNLMPGEIVDISLTSFH